MHKLRLEGQDHVSKQDLIRTAEASGLSAKSIHGTKNTSNAHSRHANWYNGWSSFLQMKQKEPALVRTWSCPLKCALTEEGMAVALELHRNAHERGMCTCGLLVDEDGGPGTPSAPRQEKVWGQWRTPEQATESKKMWKDKAEELRIAERYMMDQLRLHEIRLEREFDDNYGSLEQEVKKLKAESRRARGRAKQIESMLSRRFLEAPQPASE